MNARSLTPDQRRRLAEAIGRRRAAVDQLVAWMDAQGWYTDDSARMALAAADAALRAAIGIVQESTAAVPPAAATPSGPSHDAKARSAPAFGGTTVGGPFAVPQRPSRRR